MLGEVWPAKERDRPDGGEQIVHQGEVEHLLGGDQGDLALPTCDRFQLRLRDALTDVALHTKGGEQVLAHNHVL